VRILLISTYDLGHPPFGLASPAAWLTRRGHQVELADTAVSTLQPAMVQRADAIALFLPMHTAARKSLQLLPTLQRMNPSAKLCAYGLYAPPNEAVLKSMGVTTIIGAEFEQRLVDWAEDNPVAEGSLDRLLFITPDRSALPPLSSYPRLLGLDVPKRVGYTEASRGCKHLCRHCPVVPIYNGAFRVVQRNVVLDDVRQQVAIGAQHITFGDPDFFNGIGHALPLVREFHREFPRLTYDVTIKIEHLLKQRDALAELKNTGCLFIVSAVESLDETVLQRLDKGHTRADFYEAVRLVRAAGLLMAPTFVTFTPWTSREDYLDLLRAIMELDLVEAVAPIQLAIRLLIPSGSRLLELDEVKQLVNGYEPARLAWTWTHDDPSMDQLCTDIQSLIRSRPRATRTELFAAIWKLASGTEPDSIPRNRATVPYLNEPWYC
jgi:radical SAM superfamily enzyme YgiQ (UPF0313 family)